MFENFRQSDEHFEDEGITSTLVRCKDFGRQNEEGWKSVLNK